MSPLGPADSVSPWKMGAPAFHHFGFVVRSIADTAEDFARSVSADWDAQVIHDPLQGVRVTFLRPRAPQSPVVELVEPGG